MGAAMRSAGGMLAGSALSQLQSWHACALRSSPQLRMRSRSIVTPVTLPPCPPPAPPFPRRLSHPVTPLRHRGGCPGLSRRSRSRCVRRRAPPLLLLLSPPSSSTPSQSPRPGFRLLLSPPSPATPSIPRRSLPPCPKPDRLTLTCPFSSARHQRVRSSYTCRPPSRRLPPPLKRSFSSSVPSRKLTFPAPSHQRPTILFLGSISHHRHPPPLLQPLQVLPSPVSSGSPH